MIPKRLELQNFLSYQEVALDFGGLHVACVCGPNGAGKSSLLEAIAWCVWGQSRVSAEDDVVRLGAKETRVSFCFVHDGQTYRIIRTRRRCEASSLEFQVQTAIDDSGRLGFKSLTQKGVRATQQYILRQIKIDYETFVNAAYLRQGRADEFMLKRPSERKQVLADLLKLGRYDYLAEQAKEKSRVYKAQIPTLEMFLEQTKVKVSRRSQVQHDYDRLSEQIEGEKNGQRAQRRTLDRLKRQQQERISLGQQLAIAQEKQQHYQSALAAAQSALDDVREQLDTVEATVDQSTEIELAYDSFGALRKQEEEQSFLFETYQRLQAERLEVQRQFGGQVQVLYLARSQLDAQLQELAKSEQEILKLLEKKEEIFESVERLRQARSQLRQLDKTEAESAPLRQRFLQVRGEIDQAHTRLITHLELVESQQAEITVQQSRSPELMQAATEVAYRLEHLQKRRTYQEAVREKGIERRSFMEKLQADQRNHEASMAQLDQTLLRLDQPEKAHCPMCRQQLNEESWQELRERTLTEREEMQNQIWTIREQLAVSESEIQVLRREYRELEDELTGYASILESRGELKAKLASVDALQERLQLLDKERERLERCLRTHDYATELHQELEQIELQLSGMDYDDRNHALVRSQVDRLRWSEIKYAEIRQAEKRLIEVQERRPSLEAERLQIEEKLAEFERSDEAQQLKKIDQQLAELDYSLEKHNQIRVALREAQTCEHRYQTLQQARTQQVVLLERATHLQAVCSERIVEQTAVDQQVEALQNQLTDQEDIDEEIDKLEQIISDARESREQQLSLLGRLQQQLSQLEVMEAQQCEQQKKLEDIRHKYQVYRSLAEAFGRNGIQSLMIENLLPQLEAMTNQVLGRLSNHQLHVQFVTQRAGRKKKNKLIDTLDILIADVRGTRPYETYSGGEAFRVNFSIRLAIARLLALRSGTALQMLIVDEGFGTQDREGCDRLIAAIEAIAPDFACILTITHMPHFREAFQTRIDVSKNEAGSHIAISE